MFFPPGLFVRRGRASPFALPACTRIRYLQLTVESCSRLRGAESFVDAKSEPCRAVLQGNCPGRVEFRAIPDRDSMDPADKRTCLISGHCIPSRDELRPASAATQSTSLESWINRALPRRGKALAKLANLLDRSGRSYSPPCLGGICPLVSEPYPMSLPRSDLVLVLDPRRTHVADRSLVAQIAKDLSAI